MLHLGTNDATQATKLITICPPKVMPDCPIVTKIDLCVDTLKLLLLGTGVASRSVEWLT